MVEPSTVETKARRKLLRWMSQGPAKERGQTAIARSVGVSQPTVRDWLLGISRPRDLHRRALAALTGIPIGDWEKPAERRALEATLKRIARSSAAP